MIKYTHTRSGACVQLSFRRLAYNRTLTETERAPRLPETWVLSQEQLKRACMSISWYFTRAEVVKTFVTISEDLGWFLWADASGGEAELCSKCQMNYTTHGSIMTTFKIGVRMLLSVYNNNTITYNALEQMSWA